MDMGYVKDIKDLKIDASLGKEERIFTYESGKQIWW